MKAVFCLAALSGIIAVALTEMCDQGFISTNCTHVICAENDFEVGCIKDQCTCVHTTTGCDDNDDCRNFNLPGCHHGYECSQKKCHCRHDNGHHGGNHPVGK